MHVSKRSVAWDTFFLIDQLCLLESIYIHDLYSDKARLSFCLCILRHRFFFTNVFTVNKAQGTEIEGHIIKR